MPANIQNLPQYRGLPVMEKVRSMRPPEAYDPHKHEKREKNYGADISTLIRMIEAGEL